MLSGEELGRAIEEARKKKGISKVQLAGDFDVKPPSVQEWVKYGRISKDKLIDLFEYFSDVVDMDHWGLKSRLHFPAQNSRLEESISDLSPAEIEILTDIAEDKALLKFLIRQQEKDRRGLVSEISCDDS